MRGGAKHRLQRVGNTIESQPHAVDNAYEVFVETGDLPTNLVLARKVVERALRARRKVPRPLDDGEGGLDGVVQRLEAKADRPANGDPSRRYITGTPRRRVFLEAVHDFEVARNAARNLIKICVREGGDPTDPEFIPSDIDPPDFGTTALHIVGWPDRLVHPDHEHQMARVMRQHAAIRAGTFRDEAWYRSAAAALRGFLSRGELPADATFLLFVLTIGEMFALQFHFFGRGGEDLLAAYDAVAKASDAGRADALQRLGPLQVQVGARRHQ
jgi:hypothetical protein